MSRTAIALLFLALLDITPVPGCFQQFYERPGWRAATDKRLLGQWTCSFHDSSGEENLSELQPFNLRVTATESGFLAETDGLFDEKSPPIPGACVTCVTVAGQP